MRNQILVGDVRDMLRSLPAESVHCVVTSPPYWGLRTYGVEGQLGLESTPEEYVANMVDVFREVKRVLRKDGTLWLNLGDSYAGSGKGPSNSLQPLASQLDPGRNIGQFANGQAPTEWISVPAGLKAKDLVGIPWRVAFALQADGWYLRSDIIWSKPNPMPESVTDRPTKAHEYIFLMSKSARYFYDNEAAKEPASPDTIARVSQASLSTQEGGFKQEQYEQGFPGKKNRDRKPADILKHMAATGVGVATRNRRTVWEIATEPFEGAHFATYPTELVKPCILAGTSEYGVCAECGAPWERVVEASGSEKIRGAGASVIDGAYDGQVGATSVLRTGIVTSYRTTGWRPTCKHEAPTRPAIVLDPFLGSGTTALVAKLAGRDWLGIELNPTYAQMAHERIGTNQERLL